MLADIRSRATLALAGAVLVGVSAASALAQAPDHHGKTIKQCNNELKASATALAKAGESSAEFIHTCWWQTAAGHPTPIRGAKSVAPPANRGPGAPPAAKTETDAEMAKAKREIAKAQEQAAEAREQAAEAEAQAAKTREAMRVEAAKADAAAKAEKAARVAAEAEAKASAEAVAKMAAAEAAKAATEAKAKADAERAAAIETARAARVRAAADALQKAKAEQAARVEAAAAALAAAKAQQVEAKPSASREAEAAPPVSRREPRPRREARRARLEMVPTSRPASEVRRVVRAPRPILMPRRVVIYRSYVISLPPRRVVAAAASPKGLPDASPKRSPDDAPSPGMVMVPVRIPGLGMQQPIQWPVLPAYVPAFRAVVNNPIVPGFTKTP